MGEPEHDVSSAESLPLARRILVLGLLGLAIAGALWPVLRGQFVYDDLWLVAQNPSLQSFEKMWASLGGSYWDFLDARSAQYVGYWRPLTTISLFLGNSIGDGSPAAFHGLSLALHLAAVAVAFELARQLTRHTLAAFFAALLFGLHPVQVEPVAWISSINDPMAGLFSLWAMLAFLRWRERGSLGLPIFAAFLFLCALLAKESALALLPLFAAIDLGQGLGRGTRGAPSDTWRQRLTPFLRPYGAMLATFALYYSARIVVFGDVWAGFDRTTGHLGLTAGRDIGLRVELLGGALGLLAWPQHLNLFRDTRPEIPWNDGALWFSALWIALLAIASVWCWRRRASAALAGLLIIPAALLPALLRIEALGRFSLSERYLYVSAFGFALFAAVVVLRLAERASLRAVGVFALVLVCGACAWRSHERTQIWRDESTLFAQSRLDNPKSPYVAWGLGRVMLEEYRFSQDVRFLIEARQAFEHSQNLGLKDEKGVRDLSVLVTEEDRLQANLGLGWYYFFAALRGYDETTLDEALAVFEKTLSFFPRSFEALTGTGVVMLTQNNLVGAKIKFQAAIEENPKHLEAWYYLGKLELRRQDLPAARAAFERALELKRDDPDTLPLYASVLSESGEMAAAQQALERAYRVAPQDPQVLMGLGMLAARNREGGTAISWFDQVLRQWPTFGPAHLQKGKVLLAMGQSDRASSALQKACELNPRDFEAHYTLGAFLNSQGLGKEALPFLERALEVEPENELADELRAQIEVLRAQ